MIKVYADDVALDQEVAFVMNMHKGKANAVGRWSLVREIFGVEAAAPEDENDGNLYDRHVRESLERWRSQGQHFCNVGNGRGYYVANTRAEYEEFKSYYLGAALRKLEVARMMDEAANRRFGKIEKVPMSGQLSLIG